jgi:hypothetical protein
VLGQFLASGGVDVADGGACSAYGCGDCGGAEGGGEVDEHVHDVEGAVEGAELFPEAEVHVGWGSAGVSWLVAAMQGGRWCSSQGRHQG